MLKAVFVILFVITTRNSFTQYVRITKIIDSNHFELEDHTRIKLAGIDMPRKDNPDFMLGKTAEYAMIYAKKKLFVREFKLIELSEENGTKLVYLIEEDSIGERIYNLNFLEQGFGKFLNNIMISDIDDFIGAEQFARDNNKGIWKILVGRELMLDREYAQAEPSVMDSIDYLRFTTPKPQSAHIMSELAVSPVIGFVTGIPTGFMSLFFISAEDEWAGIKATTLGWYVGYVLGSAVSVYSISERTSKNVSLWGTMLSGVIGGGLGLALLKWNNDSNHRDQNAWYYFPPLAFPILCSILYANSIAPERFPDTGKTYTDNIKDGRLTAADIYNRTKLFQMELFRINF